MSFRQLCRMIILNVADDKSDDILDIVICSTPPGKSRMESIQFASKFFSLMEDIGKFNKKHYQVNHLFYLFEAPSSIKDDLPQRNFSRCSCSQKFYVCNWPVMSQIIRPVSGLQHDDVLRPGKTT